MTPEAKPQDRFYCRLPGGSAFLTFLEEKEDTHLRFMIVRSDGDKREYTMSQAEWEDFNRDFIVVPLEEEEDESDHIGGSWFRKDHSDS